jgi:acetyltransferase-like isoleucine patch superfamily enzyme
MSLRPLLRRLRRRRTPPEFARSHLIEWGTLSYGDPKLRFHDGDTAVVRLGAYCSIANDVMFIPGGNHRIDWVSTFPFRAVLGLPGAYEDGHPASRGDIVVGNDVWIGNGATILSGVTIGDGAVVGARAVVASPVRPYAIVVGNPAREVRRRFDDAQVDALLRIAWWSWPEDRVKEHVPELNGETVESFVARFDPGAGDGAPQASAPP